MPLNEIVIIGASKSVEKHLRKALPDDARVHAVAKQQKALEHIDTGEVSLLVVAKSTRNALAFAKKLRLNPDHWAVTVLILHQDKHTAQIRRHRKSEHAADGYLAHSKVAKGAKKAISDALIRAEERSSEGDDSRVPTELMDVITDLQAIDEVTEEDIEVLGELELDADDLEEVGPFGGNTETDIEGLGANLDAIQRAVRDDEELDVALLEDDEEDDEELDVALLEDDEELDVTLLEEDDEDDEELDVALLEDDEEDDEELDVALLEDVEDIEELDIEEFAIELVDDAEETEGQVDVDMQELLEAVEEELVMPVEKSAKPASKSRKKAAKRSRASDKMQWTPDNLEALGDLVNRLKETTRVSEQLEQDKGALRGQFDAFKAETGENERLFRDELERLQDEIATLRQELDGANADAKEWHKRAQSAEAAMGQSQSAKRELHEEVSSLKESLETRKETVAQVAEVLSKLAESLQD